MDTIDKIRGIAKERGIKLSFICDKMDVKRGYFNDRKYAGGEIPDDKLKIIADCLLTTVAYLKGETDEKKPTLVSESGISDDEKQLIDNYRVLNAEGREKAADYLDDLVQSGKYKKRDSDGMGREA